MPNIQKYAFSLILGLFCVFGVFWLKMGVFAEKEKEPLIYSTIFISRTLLSRKLRLLQQQSPGPLSQIQRWRVAGGSLRPSSLSLFTGILTSKASGPVASSGHLFKEWGLSLNMSDHSAKGAQRVWHKNEPHIEGGLFSFVGGFLASVTSGHYAFFFSLWRLSECNERAVVSSKYFSVNYGIQSFYR